jgi:hypothetical protein
LRSAPVPPPAELEQSVRETLETLPLRPEDAGLRVLALRYARVIEESRALAEAAAALPYDPDTAVQVARIRDRLAAHAVMSDLGPKLLAALDALGATPKARAAAGKPPPPGATSRLAALRGSAS